MGKQYPKATFIARCSARKKTDPLSPYMVGSHHIYLLHVPTLPWPSILAEFGGVLYADHVRFDLRHPYMERIPTLVFNSVSFR